MSVLAIVRPLPINAIGGSMPGVSRLLTPDPKEAAIGDGGSETIDIDLGASVQFDTIFLGYTSAADGEAVTVTYGAGSYTTNAAANLPAGATEMLTPRRHFIRVYDAPMTGRYIRLTGTFAAGYAIGVVAVGLAWRPTWGHEFGGGRTVDTTGSAERLFGGGFGIDEGVTAGGWNFTLGDLQPAELKKLYAIARDRGETKSLLIIEDPDQTGDLSDRCHWGLFRKIEAYERLNPLDTRWSLQIGDWA